MDLCTFKKHYHIIIIIIIIITLSHSRIWDEIINDINLYYTILWLNYTPVYEYTRIHL